MSLQEYRRKRDFEATPEPAGRKDRRSAAGRLRYVIQKHQARALHYDLRLEWSGALLSWAVPKGPSLDPAVKRLAMRVEDHPVEYAGFEGTIPAGEYGAGTVIVWDTGTWLPDEPDVDASLRRGELKFTLYGEKLNGSWVLVKTKAGYPPSSGRAAWLLIKHRDEFASTRDVVATMPRSVVSAKTIEQIAEGDGGGGRATPLEGRRRTARTSPSARSRASARRKAT